MLDLLPLMSMIILEVLCSLLYYVSFAKFGVQRLSFIRKIIYILVNDESYWNM